MMNFREELSKIRKEKLQPNKRYEEAVDKILKCVIKHIKGKEISKILAGIRIDFLVFRTEIHVQEFMEILKKESILKESFNSPEEARIILLLLEERFKKEGYEIYPTKSAALNGEFSVIIKA